MELADISQLSIIYNQSRKQSFVWENSDNYTTADFLVDTVDEQVLVYEDDYGIKGFISYYEPANFIHLLFVSPVARGHGIASQLIKAALNKLSGYAELKCVSQNHHALAFYLHHVW